MKIQKLFESNEGSLLGKTIYGKIITIDTKNENWSGDFYCNDNKLTSLEHCPTSVGRDFSCTYNNLTSLEHCPSKVGGDFYCSTNKLTSLEFGPDRVDGDYDCSDNNLTNLKHCAEHIGGDFRCDNNKITSLEFMPKNIGLGKRNGKGDFYCQYNELTTLHDIHKRVKWINSTFNCHGNPIKECILGLLLIDGLDRVRCETDFNTSSAFNILQRHLPTRTGKSPRQAVIECQKELIDAGLEEFAKL